MISLDALLVFLVAAALPVTYILLLRRWLEPESRRAQLAKNKKETAQSRLVHQHA